MSNGHTTTTARDTFVLVMIGSGRALYAYASLADAERHLAEEFSASRVVIERR